MIWSNKKHSVKAKEVPFGTLKCIELGEYGRGRKLIVLPSEVDVELGINPDITIGFSTTGKPRINRFKDDFLYLIIDCEGGYTRRGDGRVYIPSECESFEVLATGNGADGDAGRIGQWDVFLIKVKNDYSGFFRIRIGGVNPSRVYRIKNNVVSFCGSTEELSCYTDTTGIEIPGYNYQDDKYISSDWKIL